MADLWHEFLYARGINQETIDDILEEHVLLGAKEPLAGIAWKTIAEQKEEFYERLKSRYVFECSGHELDDELLHLDRDLGMDGIEVRECIAESKLRCMECSVPGTWPDVV